MSFNKFSLSVIAITFVTIGNAFSSNEGTTPPLEDASKTPAVKPKLSTEDQVARETARVIVQAEMFGKKVEKEAKKGAKKLDKKLKKLKKKF